MALYQSEVRAILKTKISAVLLLLPPVIPTGSLALPVSSGKRYVKVTDALDT